MVSASAAQVRQISAHLLFQPFRLPDTPLTSRPPAHSLRSHEWGAVLSEPTKPFDKGLSEGAQDAKRHGSQRSVQRHGVGKVYRDFSNAGRASRVAPWHPSNPLIFEVLCQRSVDRHLLRSSFLSRCVVSLGAARVHQDACAAPCPPQSPLCVLLRLCSVCPMAFGPPTARVFVCLTKDKTLSIFLWSFLRNSTIWHHKVLYLL